MLWVLILLSLIYRIISFEIGFLIDLTFLYYFF